MVSLAQPCQPKPPSPRATLKYHLRDKGWGRPFRACLVDPFIALDWLFSNFSTHCRYITLYGKFTCPIRLTAFISISQQRWIFGYIFLSLVTCQFNPSFVLYPLPWPAWYSLASAGVIWQLFMPTSITLLWYSIEARPMDHAKLAPRYIAAQGEQKCQQDVYLCTGKSWKIFHAETCH